MRFFGTQKKIYEDFLLSFKSIEQKLFELELNPKFSLEQ